jgi:pantetheine-phosphate adenylyltransferase
MYHKIATQYRAGIVGGTFDVLHIGHKKLLSTALSMVQTLYIGVTSDSYATLDRKRKVDKFERRVRKILSFARILRADKRIKIIKIEDPFGPSIENPDLEVLFATENVLHNALKINQIRAAASLRKLDIFIVPLVLAGDGTIVSSSKIRDGEIDDDGKTVYKASKEKSG